MSEVVDDIDYLEMEDADSEYFQNMNTDFSDTLEESNESMQGDLTPPTFAHGQSTILQGSQGFQFICVPGSKESSMVGNEASNVCDVKMTECDNSGARGEGNKLTLQAAIFLSSQNQITNMNPQTHAAPSAHIGVLNSTLPPAFNVTPPMENMTVFPSQLNAVILQGSNLTSIGKTENGRSVPREILPNPVITSAGGEVKQEAVSINGDSGSSDEKSGKSKSSPKRRNKKGRSVSSSAIDMEVKTEVIGPVDDSLETRTDCRPSLHEILTHKKMALMRSPEVIGFLREQQQTSMHRNTNRHSIADS